MIKVGQKVIIPWWESGIDTSKPPKKIQDLTGTIESINGAYIYVKVDNNPKYDVLELYEQELKVVESES